VYFFDETTPRWGWPRFISRNDLFDKKYELIKENVLTLTGKFKFINQSKYQQEATKSFESGRLKSVFQGRFFTDLEIKVQGKSIKAHKALVAGSSPVLTGRLFDLAENQHVLELEDLEFEVAEEMVNFIYDGKVRCIKRFAKSLLEAANKFELAQLKVYCEKYLSVNLCVENAIKTLKLSAKCHAEELKETCKNFIVM
jgi:hypothetical protein